MATSEMVRRVQNLMSELKRFAEHVDSQFNGLHLCMVYQTTSAIDVNAWTFCVSADDLDDKSERAGIALISSWMQAQVSSESLSMIERIVVLRAFDPEAAEILSTVKSPDDAHLLTGYSVSGREIARAQVFIARGSSQQLQQKQSVRA